MTAKLLSGTNEQLAKTARRLLEDQALRRMLELLGRHDDEARVVGGAVRNALLDRPVRDVDIATTATPDVVIARARSAGLRTVPIGLAHGTVAIIIDGRTFEVTTLREDIATDGRHAKIRFGRDFAQDAARRDFTMNALSMGIDGELHDYVGGLPDIAAGRVRFIGNPAIRIREDYLRILRFFRFSSEYALGAFDADGLAACVGERHGLGRLSRERVRQELLKLLVARRAVEGATVMSDAGLLGPLLQSVPQPRRMARLISSDPGADAILRLAALAVVIEEDADRLRDVLRLSNAEAIQLTKAAAARVRFSGANPPLPGVLRESLFSEGREGAADGLKLAWAESGAGPDSASWRGALTFVRDTPEPRLPFSGADLIARGIAAGRPLGQALKRLQAEWIKAGFPQEPRLLAALLDKVSDVDRTGS